MNQTRYLNYLRVYVLVFLAFVVFKLELGLLPTKLVVFVLIKGNMYLIFMITLYEQIKLPQNKLNNSFLICIDRI